jgi:hypothetical protein
MRRKERRPGEKGNPRRPHSPGRPPLPPERRRTVRVEVLLSGAEAAAVRGRALRSRRPLSAFLRESALRRGGPPAPVPLVNVRSVGQLGRLANNLNQLVKLCHQGRAPMGLGPALHELLAEVRWLRRRLLGLSPQVDEGVDR